MLQTFQPFAEVVSVADASRRRVVRFTWRDMLAMVRMGVLPEDASTELLDGQITQVDRARKGEGPDMIGKQHVDVTTRLMRLAASIDCDARHVRSQQPLICSDTYAPIPDFMIVRGTLDDYEDAPRASDALCVIEVADSSYERDTGEKLRAYAAAGVPQYVVIDLDNRRAEVFTNPDIAARCYFTREICEASAPLTLNLDEGPAFVIDLAGLLPPA
jgi:Uma2 family endonuclease